MEKSTPTPWAALNNLATLYNDQGEYSRALPLFEKALSLRREVLGEKHPENLTEKKFENYSHLLLVVFLVLLSLLIVFFSLSMRNKAKAATLRRKDRQQLRLARRAEKRKF